MDLQAREPLSLKLHGLSLSQPHHVTETICLFLNVSDTEIVYSCVTPLKQSERTRLKGSAPMTSKSTYEKPDLWMAYVGLGANLPYKGSLPGQTLRQACAALGELGTVAAASGLWGTEPDGPVRDQPPFVNGAVVLRTALVPGQLLAELLELEARYGRVRGMLAKGPRTLDLDILLMERLLADGGEAQPVLLTTPELTLPHPELHRRRFALAPLVEIAPGLRHPLLGHTVRGLLRELPQGETVERLEDENLAVRA